MQGRQAERFAERDAQIYADRAQAYSQTMAPPQAAPPPPAASDRSDTLAQLQQLGELKAQGILTEEEFAAEKAKILGSRPAPADAERSGSVRGSTMWRRKTQPVADELVAECSAFLRGGYASYLVDRCRPVPVWAWTNVLAHATESGAS
jgi:hypothetical protein